MFTVCVGLVFRSKYVQFPIIFSLQYSININTVEVEPHSDLLHICIVKPKNRGIVHCGCGALDFKCLIFLCSFNYSECVDTRQAEKLLDLGENRTRARFGLPVLCVPCLLCLNAHVFHFFYTTYHHKQAEYDQYVHLNLKEKKQRYC